MLRFWISLCSIHVEKLKTAESGENTENGAIWNCWFWAARRTTVNAGICAGRALQSHCADQSRDKKGASISRGVQDSAGLRFHGRTMPVEGNRCCPGHNAQCPSPERRADGD